MLILATETSCDETSVALVRHGTEVVDMLTYSQIATHTQYGGVVPEVASREHSVKIIPCIREVLERNSLKIVDIDLLAVTAGPGLIGSLLVGVETMKGLAYAVGKPLKAVNHIAGHLSSVFLDRSEEELDFPALILSVSGGHNDLYLMKSHGEVEQLGRTIDDAAGEAFDKVSKMLGLGYPGGPIVSKHAEQGDSKRFDFPRPMRNKGYNWSFSGLKTAVKYKLKELDLNNPQTISDICASFQAAVVEVLTFKAIKAAKAHRVKNLWLVGGVSANTSLREALTQSCKKSGFNFFYPTQIKYCTDNAAMIGAAAYFSHRLNGSNEVFGVEAQARMSMT
jgi:N6-L-threonylcarbamoyladenine synthase